MRLRLVAPKKYSIREAGGSLILTLPKVAQMCLRFRKGNRVWLYSTPSGDLLVTKKKVRDA